VDLWIDTAPEVAIVCILTLYFVAAIINLYIPKVAIDHRLPKRNPLFILQDFWHSLSLLWPRSAGPGVAGGDHAVLGRRRGHCG